MRCISPVSVLVSLVIASITVLAAVPVALGHGVKSSLARATPGAISPDGDGVADVARVSVRLTRTSLVTTTVLRGDAVVRRLPSATMRPGVRSIVWDGRVAGGTPAASGSYVLRIGVRGPRRHWRVVNAPLRVAEAPPAPPAETTAPAAFTLQWPVAGAVSSGFGPRGDRTHDGIDIPVPAMTPIVAAAAGKVREAGWVDGYGLTVVLDHPDGHATLYAHQAKLGVAAGADVAVGQVIGYVGRTGSATTEHVHFELHDPTGTPVDPTPFMSPAEPAAPADA